MCHFTAGLQELEALRLKDEARAAALEKELAVLAKQQFAAGKVLFGAREAGVRLADEISGARAQGRNLATAAARLEEQVVRQQEVLYNVDFQLVALQRRVARAAGERTQDETEALNARIAALNQVQAGMGFLMVVGGGQVCVWSARHCGCWRVQRSVGQ